MSDIIYPVGWVSPVPERIPMLNAHLTLIDAGWMDDVQTFLNAIPGPDGVKARAFFAQALTMERSHPLVAQFAAGIGKTSDEVDALFIQAASMVV